MTNFTYQPGDLVTDNLPGTTGWCPTREVWLLCHNDTVAGAPNIGPVWHCAELTLSGDYVFGFRITRMISDTELQGWKRLGNIAEYVATLGLDKKE